MSKINDPNTPLYYYIPSTSKAIQYSLGWTEPAGPPFSRLDFSRFGEPPFADTSVSVPNVVVHASLSTNFTGVILFRRNSLTMHGRGLIVKLIPSIALSLQVSALLLRGRSMYHQVLALPPFGV